MSDWYRTGTVTVTNGSASVTGILTGWSDGLVKDGDALFVPASSSYPGEILTVNGATSITLAANWHGTSQTSVSYFIFKGMQWGDVTRLATEIAELIDNQVAIIGGTGAPSDSDGYADGTRYFRDDEPEYYVKTAGTYGSPISLTGPAGPATSAVGTSTTSRTLGTGSMAFTTQANIGWIVGTRLRFTSAANPTTHYMEGVVTSYSTTSLTVTVDRFVGTGTRADWNISICGDLGSTGATGASYAATSTTSLAIGTGTKAFTTQAGLAYVAGQRVRAASAADAANYMEGRITSYSSTTLTVSVDLIGGSGTLADWNIGIAGQQGIQGIQGIQGDQGIQGATGPGYAATSTTSNTIGTGNKTFTTQAGLSYVVGASRARASDLGGTNYIEGLVTAYSSTSMTIASDNTGGSGTITSWNISLAGDKGTTGSTGATGATGPAGPTYNSTSTTSLVVATGSKAFTVASGLPYLVGQRLRAASDSTPGAFMSGLVASYSSTTLTLTVDLIGTAGTYADWNISLSGEKGDQGPSGGFGALSATKGNWLLGDGTTYGAFGVGSNGTIPLADSSATYGAAWTSAAAIFAGGYWTSSDVASAATCDIGAATTPYVRVTGTTSITSFGTGTSKKRYVEFTGALTLTYNGTSLILPGARNIITQAGDKGIFVSDASGNWKCLAWTPISSLPRETLTANRTYYVRTDGSDSNNGLTNTSGGAFLTIQKAVSVVSALDLSIYDVTIKLGNTGTFTSGADVSGPWVGTGTVILEGDTSTPANTVISTSSLPCVYVHGGGRLKIKHFKMTASASSCVYVTDGSIIDGGGLDFGSASGFHWLVSNASVFAPYGTGGYTISGGALAHFYGELGSKFYIRAVTITLSGTPAFSASFCNLILGSTAYLDTLTFSGAATGKRYDITSNAVVNTGGGGASYFPGNSAGSTPTGGQYL